MSSEPQFILNCQRAIGEDQRLAWQINALCDALTNVIKQRENFVAELDMLVTNFVPGKMAEFMKETLNKDVPNLLKLHICGREFEMRARDKDLFIEKIKVVLELLVSFAFLGLSRLLFEKSTLC
ncbi:hypothetical protein Tco_1185135 [Tanacetum coccineum]